MGKDYLGKDMRRANVSDDKDGEEKEFKTLDEGDIQLLKTYGQGPYSKLIKQVIIIKLFYVFLGQHNVKSKWQLIANILVILRHL